MMKKKPFRIFLSILAVLGLFVAVNTSSSVAKADPSSTTTNKSYKKMEDATQFIVDNTVDLKESEKKQLINKTLNAIKKGQIKYHKSNDLIFKKPSVRKIKYDNSIVQYSVSFIYVDEKNVNRVSMLNVVFDNKKKIFQTYEIDMKKLSNQKAAVKYWVNGKIQNNKTYDISQYTSQSAENTAQKASIASWSGCMQKCLSGKGMSMWAISLLGILCGASCTVGVPATAGTACYACVNTAGIIGVNAFMSCMDKC
jgi:NACalpha-BTF3-like transcription factor